MKRNVIYTCKDTCYFCTSPFQLFGILGLAVSRKEKCDLYIDPQFKSAKCIAEKISQLGLFDNVVIINSEAIYHKYFSYNKGIRNHFQIAKSYLLVDEIVPTIIGNNTYKYMFISSKAYIPRLVFLYFLKHHFDVSFNYFDDGVGSYSANSAYAPRKTDRLVRRLLFGKKANQMDFDRFVHFPAFYHQLNSSSNNRVFEIPKIWEDALWKEKINYIFGVNANEIVLNEKVIVLDEPLDELFLEKDIPEIHDIYLKIASTMRKENIVIKPHPRSKEEAISGVRTESFQGIPFECICLNTDISEKVLVSVGSTAAATPKLLLGKEPYLIMLYRLADVKDGKEKVLDDFFTALKELYSHKERVFLPKTKSELLGILECLNTNKGLSCDDYEN